MNTIAIDGHPLSQDGKNQHGEKMKAKQPRAPRPLSLEEIKAVAGGPETEVGNGTTSPQ